MKQNRRKNYFVEKEFQSRFILKFCVLALVLSAAMGVIILHAVRTFTVFTAHDLQGAIKNTVDSLSVLIICIFVLTSVIFVFAIVSLALYASHKIAGPLYRIKREIDCLKSGDLGVDFKIRKDDEPQALSDSLSQLGKSWRSLHEELDVKILELKQLLYTFGDKDAIKKKVGEIDDILKKFKRR